MIINHKVLNAICDQIYAPCGMSSDVPCKACVQIGLRKAYQCGVEAGLLQSEEIVKALIYKKDCSVLSSDGL